MPLDATGNTLWPGATAPYTSARAVTADQTVPAGRGVFIKATAAGDVRLRLVDGFLVVPVAVGPTLVDNIAVTGFTASGTTATATVSVLA